MRQQALGDFLSPRSKNVLKAFVKLGFASFFAMTLAAGSAMAAEMQTQSWAITVTENEDTSLSFDVAPRSEPTTDTSSEDVPEVASDPADSTQDTSDNLSNPEPPAEPELEPGVPGSVLINEFVSDPAAGDPEWVELYNSSDSPVLLDGWRLVDGSERETLLEGIVEPRSYVVFNGISGNLNNGGDRIQLVDAFDSIIDDLSYGNWSDSDLSDNAPVASDPDSVGRDPMQVDSFLVMTPTPGTQNSAPSHSNEEDVAIATSDSDEYSDSSDTSTSTETQQTTYDDSANDDSSASTHSTCPSGTNPEDVEEEADSEVPFVPLANIRSVEVGTQLVTEGIVSAAPGVLGRQIFYLAGSGVQVYLYNADFPDLPRGTRVRVQGELREAYSEYRLKVEDASDISVLGLEETPHPHVIDIEQVGEATEGWLVQITGIVAEITRDRFTLEDDSGDALVLVRENTEIDLDAFDVGQTLTVTSIVSQRGDEYRLLPREQADIEVVEESDEESSDVIPFAGTMTRRSGGGSTGSWVLTTATALFLTGSAAVHAARKRFIIPVMA